jgi:hypothetical protein
MMAKHIMGSFGSGKGKAAGFCDYINELSSPIKSSEFLN